MIRDQYGNIIPQQFYQQPFVPQFYQQPFVPQFYQQPFVPQFEQLSLNEPGFNPGAIPFRPSKKLEIVKPKEATPVINPNNEALKQATESIKRALFSRSSSDVLPTYVTRAIKDSGSAPENSSDEEFSEEFSRTRPISRSLTRTRRKLLFENIGDLQQKITEWKTELAETVSEARSFFEKIGVPYNDSNFHKNIYTFLKEKKLLSKNVELLKNIVGLLDNYATTNVKAEQNNISQILINRFNNINISTGDTRKLLDDFSSGSKTSEELTEIRETKNRIKIGLRDRTNIIKSGGSTVPFIYESDLQPNIIDDILDNRKLINQDPTYNTELENTTVDAYINAIKALGNVIPIGLGVLTFAFENNDKKLEQQSYILRLNWNFAPKQSELFKNAIDNVQRYGDTFDFIHVSAYFNKFFKKNTYTDHVNSLKVHVSCTVNTKDNQQFDLHYGRDQSDRTGKPNVRSWVTLKAGSRQTRKLDIIGKYPQVFQYIRAIYDQACEIFNINNNNHFGKKKNQFKQICMDIKYLKKG